MRLALTLILVASTAIAGEVTLAWNPSPDAVDGYLLEATSGTNSFTLSTTNLTAKAEADDGTTWTFQVRAEKAKVRSTPSNQLTVYFPRNATNLITVAVERFTDLTTTNSAMFLRLKLLTTP